MSDDIKLPELLPCRSQYENRSAAHRVHGHTMGGEYSPTYHSWQSMLVRCRYLGRDQAKKHVGRGITVSKEWLKFEQFLADMGERPEGMSLDRIDNDGNYEKNNCKWSTPRMQARNRRNTKLDLQQATQVALRRIRGETCKSIAAAFGISESLPREIVKGRTWPEALPAALAIIRESP